LEDKERHLKLHLTVILSGVGACRDVFDAEGPDRYEG
jgi:hypothetical protein